MSSVNQELRVHARAVELQNKVNELEQKVDELELDVSLLPGAIGATVGSGGEYATLQAALDANETELYIVSDLAVTAIPDAPSSDYALHIIIQDGLTLTFQNAFFDSSRGFDAVTIESSRPTAVAARTQPPSWPAATLAIDFTDPGLLDIGLLENLQDSVVKNLVVVDTSTTDGLYLMRSSSSALVQNVYYEIDSADPRVLAGLSDNSNLIVRDLTFEISDANDYQLVLATSGSRIQGLWVDDVTGDHTVQVRGPDTILQGCELDGCSLVILSDDVTVSDCFIYSGQIESTPGTGDLARDQCRFSQVVVTPADDLVVTGSLFSFMGGTINTGDFLTTLTLAGTSETISNSFIETSVAGDLVMFGTSSECAVIGCSTFNTTFVLDNAGTDNRIIGNAFSAAPTDTGLGTVLLGNTS